jgi:hypothetical protein
VFALLEPAIDTRTEATQDQGGLDALTHVYFFNNLMTRPRLPLSLTGRRGVEGIEYRIQHGKVSPICIRFLCVYIRDFYVARLIDDKFETVS